MTTRNALFTALAVGNAAATSGASKTMFVSSANRAAYFPRTPPEKSYSSRIFSRTAGRLRLLGFFIRFPFPTASGSSADDTGDVAALDVSDDHEQLSAGSSNQDEAVLTTKAIRIGDGNRQQVRECGCRHASAYPFNASNLHFPHRGGPARSQAVWLGREERQVFRWANHPATIPRRHYSGVPPLIVAAVKAMRRSSPNSKASPLASAQYSASQDWRGPIRLNP